MDKQQKLFHQIFPLRYGWLYNFKKLSTDDLMAEWGVSKNIVEVFEILD